MKEPLLNVVTQEGGRSPVLSPESGVTRVSAILRVVECSGATAGAFLRPLRFMSRTDLPKRRVEQVQRGTAQLMETRVSLHSQQITLNVFVEVSLSCEIKPSDL